MKTNRTCILLLSMALLGYTGQAIHTSEKTAVHRKPSEVAEIKPQIERGIVYWSADEGRTWVNRSTGLPENLDLTDIASSEMLLGLVSKQQGVFLYDFQNNRWKKTWNPPPTKSNLDAMIFFRNQIFAGTNKDGVFVSPDMGKTWKPCNQNLGNLTIRKFKILANKLYVGTNEGLYSFDEIHHQWMIEYRQPALQVNGITDLDGEIYIGTNMGAFKKTKGEKYWKSVLNDRSLHNISAYDQTIYAMVYSELMVSTDHGVTWQNLQKGLPATLYTFQVMKSGNTTLAGQWDGIYRKEKTDMLGPQQVFWQLSSSGLPEKFAVTEMNVHTNYWIIGSSH